MMRSCAHAHAHARSPRMSGPFLAVLLAVAVVAVLPCVAAYAPLSGSSATSVPYAETVDLGSYLSEASWGPSRYNMVVLGTYAADFNAIEYAQRLRYYLPALRARGVGRIGLVLNAGAPAASALAAVVDLPVDDAGVDLLSDPGGACGRAFGVGRGWKSDDPDTSPYLKLFGMLFGLGAWATLPAVIGGYIGNPWTAQPWIEDALAVGQVAGRWPDTALEMSDGEVVENKFAALPLVGGWKRRPLELATLRLQNMIDISIKKWDELAPDAEALEAGVLTQLGGCVVVEAATGKVIYEWKDPGICAVANFENILKKLPLQTGGETPTAASA